MKVLVTGGAGFIGSHIVDALAKRGHEVHIVDNLSTGSLENVTLPFFYNLDMRSDEMGDLIERVKPEVIIHQAAQAQVPASIEHPLNDLSLNIESSLRLMEWSRQSGVRKIIYASSAAIYGIPEVLPIPESHPIRPLSPYGISKFVPELYLSTYAYLHGLQYTAFRYANVYGPRQSTRGEAGVVALFIGQMVKGLAPTIFGDGEATRDYIYAGDVAEAVVCALTAGDGESFNVGTRTSISVNELYQMLSRLLGVKTPANYGPERPGDIVHSTLDNHKIVSTLNWSPQVPLEEGLRRTVKWAQEGLARHV